MYLRDAFKRQIPSCFIDVIVLYTAINMHMLLCWEHWKITCKYQALEDEMIGDRIVLGVRGNSIRLKLLQEKI